MYQIIYDLFVSSFFAGAVVTGEMQLVATLVAVASCLFVFSIPFMVVWKVIKLIVGR